jgi:hypothetical protein
MPRAPNTNAAGKPFSDIAIKAVWNKCPAITGFTLLKRDACGAIIGKIYYGQQHPLGWEIDHIQPVAKGGTDALYNLQAMHWENNRHKGDNYPDWDCKVTD